MIQIPTARLNKYKEFTSNIYFRKTQALREEN